MRPQKGAFFFMKILITGGSGFIGSHACTLFSKQGHEVFVLTRRNKHTLHSFPACKAVFDLNDALPEVDAVINLAGASIAAKYLNRRREDELLKSRINIMDHLLKAYRRRAFPKIFIQASASGIYPSGGTFDEDGETDGNFSELIQAVENAALQRFSDISNLMLVRFGVVMGKGGGFMRILSYLPSLYFFPDPQNYIPWLSIDDAAEILLFLCTHPLEGVVNAVSPQKLTLNELLSYAKKPGIRLPLPYLLLKCLPDKRCELLTVSHTILPAKLKSAGFCFKTFRK